MRFKQLSLADEDILLVFLQSLSSETLNNWNHYGKIFDLDVVRNILMNNEIKIAGIEDNEIKIVVLGHLHGLNNTIYRLGIVSLVPRKGYGFKMMTFLIDHCRLIGVSKISLSVFQDNIPAINLYKKCGFKVVKEFTDRPRSAYEMELIL